MMLQNLRTQVIASLGSPAVPVAYGQAARDQSGDYCVMWRVGGTFQGGVAGPIDHSTALIQIDLYSSTYARLMEMVELLREGLHGYRAGSIQGVFLESVRDGGAMPDIKDQIFTAQMDFEVLYVEPAA
jgi:hypothetical protein